MKYTHIIAVSVGLFIFSAGFAQLKGPRAKNSKAWEKSTPSTEVVTTEKDAPSGPMSKNAKPWIITKEFTPISNEPSAKTKLKGPKAKNFRYGKQTKNEVIIDQSTITPEVATKD